MESDRKLVYVVEEEEHIPTPTTIKWKDQTLSDDTSERKTWVQKLKSFTLFTEDRRMSRSCQLMTFFGFLIVVIGTGEVGRLSTEWLWAAGHTWSEDLIHPPFALPHQEVDLRVLWLLLYISIAFAGWRVCMRRKLSRARILAYGCVLLFNCLWVPVFYGWHQIFLALVDVVSLMVSTFVLCVSFWQVEKKAACALVPYFLWVVYGVAVVAGYWWLNYEKEGFYNREY